MVFGGGENVYSREAQQRIRQGFINLPNGQELFVRYQKAQVGRPTMVVLNGLTSDTDHYRNLFESLTKLGVGVVLYDMRGQGRTISRQIELGKIRSALDVGRISHLDQVEDLRFLLDRLSIREPVHIFAHSYGGPIGLTFASLYPERVRRLVLAAPYVAPLKTQNDMIRYEVFSYRMMVPFTRHGEEELYDYFLRDMVYRNYWRYEPELLRHVPADNRTIDIKLEAVFRLAQGVRLLDVTKMVQDLAPHSLDLLIAGDDQYLRDKPSWESTPPSTTEGPLARFWYSVPVGIRSSRLLIDGVEHDIAGMAPHFLAAWLSRILANDPQIGEGRTFEGNPVTGEVYEKTPNGPGMHLRLPKDSGAGCSWWMVRMGQATEYADYFHHVPMLPQFPPWP